MPKRRSVRLSPALSYSRLTGIAQLSPQQKPRTIKGLVRLTVNNLTEEYDTGPFQLSNYPTGFAKTVDVFLSPETAIKLARKILKDAGESL